METPQTTPGQPQPQAANDLLPASVSTTSTSRTVRTRPSSVAAAATPPAPGVVHHPQVRQKYPQSQPPRVPILDTDGEEVEEENEEEEEEPQPPVPPPSSKKAPTAKKSSSAASTAEAPLPPFPTKLPPHKRGREEDLMNRSVPSTLTRQPTMKYAQDTNVPATFVQPSAVTQNPPIPDMSVLHEEAVTAENEEIPQEMWEEILGPILGELEMAGEHLRTIYPIAQVPGYRLRVTGIKWQLELENPKKKGWFVTKTYCHTDLKSKPTKIKSFYVPKDKKK